jgi:hypothetical protein
MRKVLMLLAAVVLSSAVYSYSCSGSAFYDISRDYITKKDGIYYEYSYKATQNNNGKMELIPNVTESSKVSGADTESFEKINKFIAKDKKNLYYKNVIIGKSSGFESLGSYYTYKPCTSPEENYIIKNSDNVFINNKKLNLNPESVDLLYLDTKQNTDTGFTILNLYVQDTDGVYYYSEFAGSMVKILDKPLIKNDYKFLENAGNSLYFITPYKVYLNGKEIKGADAKSFKILNNSRLSLSNDKDSYYKDHTMISKTDYERYRKMK